MQFLEPRQISKSIGRRKGPWRCIGLHISSRRRCASAVIRRWCGWQSGVVHDAICASPLRPVSPSLRTSSRPVSSSSRLRRRRAACARAANDTRGGRRDRRWVRVRQGSGWRVEGLSRSTSCIDPARSRTRLLSLLPVSRRLFPPLSVHFPVCILFLPLSPSSPLSLLLVRSFSFSLFLTHTHTHAHIYIAHSFPSFLPCTPIITKPFRREYGLSSD